MSTSTEGWDYFISYASGDERVAEELFDELTNLKKRPFCATRSLELGANWSVEIPDAQKKSKATVVLISARSADAHYQATEVSAAIDLMQTAQHVVVPVRLPGSTDAHVPFGLHVMQMIVEGGAEMAAVAARLVKGNGKPRQHQPSEADALAELRRQMLIAVSHSELNRVLFGVEAFLATHPLSIEARSLKAQIERALSARRARSLALLTLPPFLLAIGAGAYVHFREEPAEVAAVLESFACTTPEQEPTPGCDALFKVTKTEDLIARTDKYHPGGPEPAHECGFWPKPEVTPDEFKAAVTTTLKNAPYFNEGGTTEWKVQGKCAAVLQLSWKEGDEDREYSEIRIYKNQGGKSETPRQ
jgi:hypothetical protein